MRSLWLLVPAPMLLAGCHRFGCPIFGEPPDLRLDEPRNEDSFEPGEPLTLCAAVVASDGASILSVRAVSDVDGVLETTESHGHCSAGNIELQITLSDAAHELALWVTDDYLNTASAEVQLLPTENTPPWCQWLAPVDGALLAPDAPVHVRALVGDVGTAPARLQVTVVSDLDGLLASGPPSDAGAVALDWQPDQPGIHTLTLHVEDARGAGATCQARVEVDALDDTGAPDTGAPDTGAPDTGAPDTGGP